MEKYAVLWQVHISNHFWKPWTSCPLAKEEKDHSECYQWKVQRPASVNICGSVSAHGMRTGTSVKAPLMLGGKMRLYNNICHQMTSYAGMSCLFQQDNVKSHSACVTEAWLCIERVKQVDWLQFTNDSY